MQVNETQQDREVRVLRRKVRALHAELTTVTAALSESTGLTIAQKDVVCEHARVVAYTNQP